jgi:peroxiredoxin
MNRLTALFKRAGCAAMVAALLAAPAHAALKPGASAPMFATQAALAGKPFAFDMAEALRKGPVVLYFFPKAFTQGCTIEAHAFAEATPEFNKMGATVIGISHDDIDTLEKFSTEACRDQFAVASDVSAAAIRAYDAGNAARPGTASRISYVIDPQGKIAFMHEGTDPLEHVRQTLEAVRRLHQQSGAGL